jgi:nucleotide-binding universal stress UspA family protein
MTQPINAHHAHRDMETHPQQTVIAALDDSAIASTVLHNALCLARTINAALKVLHVRENGGRTARALAVAARVEYEEVEGDVTDTLTQHANEPETAAMVLGLRQRPGGARPAGHVARAVATRTSAPIVLVPPEARHHRAFARVLIPIEASISGQRTLGHTLAFLSDAEVIALHVIDDANLPRFSDQVQHETGAWMDEFRARFCASGHDVHLELRVGDAAAQILALADERDIHLIALDWSQRLALGHAIVVQTLMEASRIPILLFGQMSLR